jgi:hypothetical protein
MRTVSLKHLLSIGTVCSFFAGVMWIGCDHDRTTKPDPTPTTPLRFTRADGSDIVFPAGMDTFVWCGPWERQLTTPALNIRVQTSDPHLARWELSAVLQDVRIGVPMAFPNYFVWDHPDSALIFLLDPPNELSTQQQAARGYVTFYQLPCSSSAQVDFWIDAVLGSEFGDGPSVAMKGRFSAPSRQHPVP